MNIIKKLAIVGLLIPTTTISAYEVSGYFEFQNRYFPETPALHTQSRFEPSIALEAEFYKEFFDGKQSFTFKPFGRLDKNDRKRRHFDIRELNYIASSDNLELKVGISKEFWGVTESRHLVDIINQTDILESRDGENKLGQPMVKLSLEHQSANYEFYVLPLFRERKFPSNRGHFFFAYPIDESNPIYDSGARKKHIDLAARVSKTIGLFDFALSHFRGTSRVPLLVANPTPFGLTFRPRYYILNQTGIELQLTLDNILWKLEAASIRRLSSRNTEVVGGFEYTVVGVFGTSADLGLLSEYHFDDRGRRAFTAFNDDIMAGFRLALNNEQSTEILAAAIYDRISSATFGLVEASHRLSDNWKFILDVRTLSNIRSSSPLYSFRKDSLIELSLRYYF